MGSQRNQQGNGQQEFCGGDKPVNIAGLRMVFSQEKRQQPHGSSKHSGLPQMIGQWRSDDGPRGRREERDRKKGHEDLSFLASRRRAFSACLTSSKVSLPDSIKCAMTGCVWPPNRLRSSSINRRCAAWRETMASKMCALLIFFTRRNTFLRSMRYTVVCTV